jgi:hypothetical protein
VLSRAPIRQTLENQFLSHALLFADRPLLNVLSDPAIGMAEEHLCRLDVHSLLSKHGCQTVPEGMPAYLFLDSDPL